MERGQIWDSSCFLRLVSLPMLWSTGMECSRARVWGSSCFRRLVSSRLLSSSTSSNISVSSPACSQRYVALTIQGKVKPEGSLIVYKNENQQG